MEHEQELVQAFHEKYGFPRGMLIRGGFEHVDWLDVGFQRDRLMSEELNEWRTAWHNKDLLGVADAMGDLAYTVLGTAVVTGIQLGPILREIHKSNMTKDVGMFKPIKGKLFRLPELRPILMKQGFDIRQL